MLTLHDANDKHEAAHAGPEEDKSRSQRKREHLALQTLAQRLVALPSGQLDQVPMPAELAEAVHAARRMERKALKRQIRLLARLLSDNAAPVLHAVEGFDRAHRSDTARLKRLERWRERLLDEGDGALGELTTEFPHADRQYVRSLVRSAHRQRDSASPPKAKRELFRYLRELDAQAGELP